VLAAAVAIVVFLVTTAILGTVVLFLAVSFLIGFHGGGPLPELLHLPVLATLAVGVSYVGFRTARWTHATLSQRSLPKPAPDHA
jgi:hypothetical protein